MMDQKSNLGAIAHLLTGHPFKSAEYTDDPTALRLLRGDNVGQGRLRWDGVRRSVVDDPSVLSRYALRPGDVILAMDRPWIDAGLKWAAVRESDVPSLLVQRVACLRSKDGNDQRFLRYVIANPDFTDYVLSIQTGTAVPHISGGQILAYPVSIPPLEQQVAIGSILGALDDKIEANMRMTETLEGIARRLFQSWFVDFGPVRAKADGRPTGLSAEVESVFPNRLQRAAGGEVPTNWALRPLSGCGRFLNGLALQKYPASGDAYLPVIKIAELRAGRWDAGDRASPSIPTDYVVDDGDLIFSWSGSLIHRIWCGGRGALNQHLFKVTSNTMPQWFLFEAIEQHMTEFRSIAAGKATTMGHIQRHHLDEALVAVAPPPVMDAADAIMAPIYERMLLARKQSRTLAALRDLLLPKLMSGAIRVTDAEHQLAAIL